MIPRLIALVAVFIAAFEGPMIRTLLTHRVGSAITASSSDSSSGKSSASEALSSSSAGEESSGILSGADSSAPEEGLAGLAAALLGKSSGSADTDTSSQEAEVAETDQTQSSGEVIDSASVVPEQAAAVDDSYFQNAVFIGDSRMEGFRNASGITQGTFLTSVGLSIGDMDKQIISTSDGQISVYQGLSGRQYDRIYLMLGTNDLGFYPWDQFQPTFENVIEQFHELQPGAVIYICSVIYLEESKIGQGFEYDNNENVQKINSYILSTCEDLWYSCYINLNEIFSDGNGELIPGASADGIHLEPEYCEDMLDYLKTHYIPDDEWEKTVSENGGVSAVSMSDETEGDETEGMESEGAGTDSQDGSDAGNDEEISAG